MDEGVKIKWDERGLVPAVVQDAATGQVLMLAYMNREALQRTLESGRTWFYSRSRGELWPKGETSGNRQEVREVALDCDGDAILVKVEQKGAACHTGERSCFFRRLRGEAGLGPELIGELWAVFQDRARRPREESYVSRLLAQGADRILKKVGEEAGEVIIAAKNGDKNELVWELADLLFHSLLLTFASDLTPQDVLAELARRRH
ncbi:MAG: phosphoribosyl-AMP cyclohydrolase / phosphoribosyl-ATP pyrophosphohydrolase [Bacillota bacterium]|nr:phosphoribosyl-AMP cyclohydrolase / phosphoribosyl-ATP pyrophosphohydrolase [Bacillota bacterium]MDK2925243.1 phosphoribosyl-AMP cyclohydrolase / phosphoribosyl-ATP pyrophosphohydrolase [Bacillota bacterium]